MPYYRYKYSRSLEKATSNNAYFMTLSISCSDNPNSTFVVLHPSIDSFPPSIVKREEINAPFSQKLSHSSDGLVCPIDEGTPQGGPLSPLLSNLVLDDFDKELTRRGPRVAASCNA